jgi:hypothetical protein
MANNYVPGSAAGTIYLNTRGRIVSQYSHSRISFIISDQDASTKTFFEESNRKRFQLTRKFASVAFQLMIKGKRVAREAGLACSLVDISLDTHVFLAGSNVESQIGALSARLS